MRKILHLHGIGSAGGGATASVLKKLFSDIEVISPDIPVRPLEAFAFISWSPAMSLILLSAHLWVAFMQCL